MRQLAATYNPVDLQPQAIFNFADMGTYVLTVIGAALAVYALYAISKAIGMKVIAWMGGSSSGNFNEPDGYKMEVEKRLENRTLDKSHYQTMRREQRMGRW